MAPAIQLECHEYQLFMDGNDSFVSFQRVFPVEDLESRRLAPVARSASVIAQGIATRTRGAKSVALIVDNGAIADDMRIDFSLGGLVRPEVASRVVAWLDQDPLRRDVRWVNDPAKRRPLRWAASDDPAADWTPTALRDEIFIQAGEARPTFSALDAWSYAGEPLYQLANRFR